jgi:hypothetical protein
MGMQMNVEKLRAAADLAQRTKHVFIATVSSKGVPHLAACRTLSLAGKKEVALTEWFCPETVTNLSGPNQCMSVVIWDRKADCGYQLIGDMKKEEDLAYLDGYGPGLEEENPVPQVERKIALRVDKIIDFRLAPYTDREE